MFSPAIFESLMLIAFGCAWPVSIYRSYKSKSNGGKSAFFLYLILFGYICGMIFQWEESTISHYVMYIFLVNSVMVLIDILLYHRNACLADN